MTSGLLKRFVLLVGIILGEFTSNFRILGKGLSDSFHFGEYFVSEINSLTKYSENNYIMIHGLVDVFPAKIAKIVFGSEHYFFPTWAVYQLLNLLAALCFASLVIKLIPRIQSVYRIVFLLGIFAAGTVGYRDLFLILCLFLIIKLRIELGNPRYLALTYSFLGAATLISMYWTWNRGILALASSLLFILGSTEILSNLKKYILGLLIAQFALQLTFPLFTPASYVQNFFILSSTSKEWMLPLSQAWPMFIEISVITIFVLKKILDAFNMKSRMHRGQLQLLIPLVMVVGSIQWVVGRADNSHLISFYWVFFFSLAYIGFFENEKKIESQFLFLMSSLIAFTHILREEWTFSVWILSLLSIFAFLIASELKKLNLLLMCVATVLTSTIVVKSSNSSYAWTDYVIKIPENSELVSPGVAWSSREVMKSETRCILDMTNSGLINGLTQKPSCTKFGYLVYANSRYEDELVHHIKEEFPQVIVWSAEYWSFSIDGITTHDRFPKLTQVLNDNYGHPVCRQGYCLRKKL